MWYHFSINEGKRFQGEGEIFMNEYELISQAKEGCEDAFESIFKKYVPVVLRQKRRYYLRYYELDDWLQEGRIVCHQSIANFDEAQNVTFGLFFKINFERWVVSALRFQEAQKRQIYRYTDSLENQIELHGEGFNPAEEDHRAGTSLEYIFVRETLENFSVSLSKFEKEVYRCILEGKDISQIAKELDVPEKKVICGYSRLKRKLKDQIAQ